MKAPPGRDDRKTIHHFWGSDLLTRPASPGRIPATATLEPLWNLFDLTPEGRGTNWYPELSYT